MTIRRRYVDGPYGQLHLRETRPVPGRTPLVCLHATAYSSRSFEPLMASYDGIRQVIAIDAPGYGGSDRPAAPISIAGYARAMEAAIGQCAAVPVELLGYHTGAYIAAELAIARLVRINRLTMIGIPYFEALDRDAWYRRLVVRHELGDDLDQFAERWSYLVGRPLVQGVVRERAFGHFIDELQAWPEGWWAHEAMFAWPATAMLPRIRQAVLVLNPAGHLAEPSRQAAALVPQARVIEMPGIEGSVLETAPTQIRDAIEAELVEQAG